MACRPLIRAAILLGLGLNLASCGSFVADHWPHWAGGMPEDVPPRPGTPGYAEFIAHGQATQDATNSSSPQNPSAAAQNGSPQAPAAPAPVAAAAPVRAAASPSNEPSQDSSVVNGGLY